MSRVAIVTDDPGWHGARLVKAFAKRGLASAFVSLSRCSFCLQGTEPPVVVPGFEPLPSAVFVRGVPGGSLEQVVHYLDVLHALALLGVAVYNEARSIERTVDKSMTSFLLKRAGVPTPPTWVTSDRVSALTIAERELRAGYNLVSKPLFGSQGEGLRRYTDLYDLTRLSDSNGVYYLQRFVAAAGDFHDYRVMVVRGRAVAAMRRVGISWVNNVAQGARCEPVPLGKSLCKLAEAAVDALEIRYAGVDLIADAHGDLQVIEVNSVPAWRGLQSVTEIDLADTLVDDLLGYCSASSSACVNAYRQ